MNKITSGVCFTFLLATFLFVLLFPSVYCTPPPSNEPAQSIFETRRQVSQGTLEINVWVFLSGRYGFFDLNVRDEVVVEITTPSTPPPTPYEISAVVPFSLTEVLPPDLNYTYGFWGHPPVGILSIYLPANTRLTEPIKLEGHLRGKSVFWRNTAEIPVSNINSSIAYASSYRLILVPPSPSRVLRIYSRPNPGLSYQEATIRGQKCFVVSQTLEPIVILYEPAAWKIFALLVMSILIFIVFMIPYTPRFRKIGAVTLKLMKNFRQRFPLRIIVILRRLHGEFLGLNSSKLLTAYVLCGLLMISLSFVAGPDPRLKVYVFASTQENARTISDFVDMHGGVTVSTFDEMGDLRSLANLGVFEAAVVGDFFPPSERVVNLKIYPALDNIRSIIILKIYAFDAFSSGIHRRYADKTVVVEDLDALELALRDVHRRPNALGLNESPTTYMGVSAFVGLCSLIIVFFGLAFLACKLIEVGKKPGVGGLSEAIVYAVLYIAFTQVIYIVCSVLLGIPLGLHTSRLEAKVTAVSFLGFGGGSRPRLYAGLAGFLFGSFISLKEGLKLEKAGFMAFLVMSFFVIVDPLTSGILFYEFILLYTVGPYFETALTTLSYVKNFLAHIGVALGGWASPTLVLSTGIILYYTGAIPFCLFPRLKRSTATILLFSCAFCAASGGIRIADMNPWATVASLIPGVMAGFIFAAVFYLISLAETALRAKIGRGSSD